MNDTPMHDGDERSGVLPELSRRTFLAGATAAAGLTVIPLAESSEAWGVTPVKSTHTLMLRRREDQLRLQITLQGMLKKDVVVKNSNFTVFDPAPAGIPYLIVNLGPQVIGEQDFYGPNHDPVIPAGARLSGDSRLAFRNVHRLFASVPGMLMWASGVASVEGVAEYLDGESIIYAKDPPRLPRPNETLIEMPWWLILSPHRESAWAHANQPVNHDGRTEAWHTRLAARTSGPNPVPVENPPSGWQLPKVTVRAVWLRDPNAQGKIAVTSPQSPDPDHPFTGLPFAMKPDPLDRSDLVRLSTKTQSGNSVVNGGAAKAIPATMALSPMGGTLRVDATWNAPLVSNLVAWQQRIWQGRVTFTRIVRQGALYPFGFPAVYVQTVARKFEAGPDGTTRPFLHRTARVIVTVPDLKLTASPYLNGGRRTPFVSITCRTKATPNVTVVAGGDGFVPEVEGTGAIGQGVPVMFDLVATDWEGRPISFQMPMMFSAFDGARQTDATEVLNDYGLVPQERRSADLGGQSVAFASTTAPGKPGTTSFPTGIVRFTVVSPEDAPAATGSRMKVYPQLENAAIVAESVSRIAGSSTATHVAFPDSYVVNGFGAGNSLHTFLQVAGGVGVGVTMGAKSAGGMITPSFDVGGFSRSIGPVLAAGSELDKYTGGTSVAQPDLAGMFGQVKLLGGISLADILGNGFDLAGPRGMRITSTVANGVSTTVMSWTPSLDVLANSPVAALLNVTNASLTITSTTTVSLADGHSSTRTVGELKGLGLALVGSASFIAVSFDRLAFTSQTGTDTDIDVKVGDITFLGGLSFMETLAQFLPLGGNGLSIDVDGSGISAKLKIALPDIAIGAFTLTGIAVGAGLTIPFGSDPMRFRFNFSSPEDPFGCTVLGIGGAGSFVSAFGLDGVERIEVSAMLQACVAIDVGVASGMIRMAAGITFVLHVANGDQTLELTAFVRITGRVEVICIIEVSIELYLGLTAVIPPAGQHMSLTGEASVTVKVSVLCFSKSVEVSVRKTVQGPVMPGNPPYLPGSPAVAAPAAHAATRSLPSAAVPTPSFGDGMTQADWATWCEAFA